MPLSAAEQRKYHRLKQKFGPDVAQQYDSWVQAGKPGGTFDPKNPVTPTAPGGAPPSVDFNNPQSMINYQQQVNDRTVAGSTPNVVNDFGSRKVERDPTTGQITVTEGLTGTNKQLMEQGQQNQGMINTEFQRRMGMVGKQGEFDPRKGQIDQQAFDPSTMGQLPQWEDPRKTQIQAPSSFRDLQQQTYQNALQDYTSSVREDQKYRRDMLEQQMANEGIPRESEKYQRAMAQFEKTANQGIEQATRAAYRDSMDVGSQAFQNQLGAQGQEFNQNFQSGDQRFNQSYNARGQDAGLQAQRFGQQSTINDRAERMAASEYMTPNQVAAMYMGSQGQYKDPNLGPTQQINTPTTDVLGYGTNYLKQQQQGSQFNDTLEYNKWAKQGDWNTARSTAGAGKDSVAEKMALLDHQAQLERENWSFQQGLTGGAPDGTSWGDVGGSFVGGAVGGATSQFVNGQPRSMGSTRLNSKGYLRY